jgi:hypothetical protein
MMSQNIDFLDFESATGTGLPLPGIWFPVIPAFAPDGGL